MIGDHATEFLDESEALQIEDTIWWLVGRRAILRGFLERAKRQQPIRDILEIGCGSGGNLPLLSRYGVVSGLERSLVLAKRAEERKVARRIHVTDFFEFDSAESFDLYCLFDVLEHNEDHTAFVKRLSRLPPPNHMLLLTVPACQFLYGPHDVLLHHYRRYSKRGLEMLLAENGYDILMSGYYLFFLFPVLLASRLAEKVALLFGRKQKKVQLGRVPHWVNSLLAAALKTEALFSRVLSFPIGGWVITLAKRRMQ